jgi:hypothetical protein
VADGHDKKVLILQRDSLQQVGSFGDGGRLPGRFHAAPSVAVDPQGNVYTGENLEGKRVQNPDQFRRWRPVLCRAQPRGRLEGEPLHDRDLCGQAPAAVPAQGTKKAP